MNRTGMIWAALVLAVAVGLPFGSGCGVPSGPIAGGGDNGGDGAGGGDGGGMDNGDGGDGGDGDGGGGNGGSDGLAEPVTGAYDPSSELTLETDGVTLLVPAGALQSAQTLTLLAASEVATPGAIPGAVDLAGGQFGPEGLQFLTPVEVTATLLASTLATALPVLTYDDANKRWVGTGDVGAVADDGLSATFPLDHFSIAGVPDPVPFPVGGDAIPDLVTIPNNGVFVSSEISSETVSLTYSSSVGGSLEVDVTSETVNESGQPRILFMHLSAEAISVTDQFVIAQIGGSGSVFDTGDFRVEEERLVGVAVMSVSGSSVSATVYVASPSRVIFGTLTGEAG